MEQTNPVELLLEFVEILLDAKRHDDAYAVLCIAIEVSKDD